ncbi:MAG TPA: VWA domain-containing protein [Candidatus Eisenbacteria bacterium]|nr:VWA domain-containing protein [Candidatus Eisenbacteria bacterium]
MLEFPVRFENPLFGIFGAVLGAIFTVLFYLSYNRVRRAEKKLELVKWQRVRKAVNITNIIMKVGIIVSFSFLLAVPYFPTVVKIPVQSLSPDQLAKSSVTVMMLMDVSYSMNTSDLSPTRLEAAEQVGTLFVNDAGPGDLIGFISFAGRIYDETLPTANRTEVTDLIANQTVHNSTAIGTTLETAIGILEQSQGGKAIVLFSDGKNNYGITNLTEVGQAAAALKIPIFTVFVGTYGIGNSDPEPLRQISNMTGGVFHEIRTEEMTTLAREIAGFSQQVKVGALKTVLNELPFEAKDYHTALVIFASLLVCCLFLTWFTGI